MALGTRGLPFKVPTYSLTGDILSYRRCGLQYRYYSGSSLPPSRPVQLWTGEFSHEVLEESYKNWELLKPSFPWPCNVTPWPKASVPLNREKHDVGEIGDIVEKRLERRGMRSRSIKARDQAYERLHAAINILGRNLFPLITTAEERISGIREMPFGSQSRGDRYELTGIADVISSISLGQYNANPLVQTIQTFLPELKGNYDIIVDYKAARRPPINSKYWNDQQWQIQTYAWLRNQVPNSTPIGGGVIIYLNELKPSQKDLIELKREITIGLTDVFPENGSKDYYAIHRWQPKDDIPILSDDYKLSRAIRVITTSAEEIQQAVEEIDKVVIEIEDCATRENKKGSISAGLWPHSGEKSDCTACDFRHFCPSNKSIDGKNHIGQSPLAPG